MIRSGDEDHLPILVRLPRRLMEQAAVGAETGIEQRCSSIRLRTIRLQFLDG
jgi:hypothetical protein